MFDIKILILRYACAIPDNQKGSVYLIGGHNTKNHVTEYGNHGYVRDLPKLNDGRHNPGCGSYYENGKQVCKAVKIIYSILTT